MAGMGTLHALGSGARCSTTPLSTQRSTAQHGTAQHSSAQRGSPQRDPIMSPSSGVNPMVVSTHLPPATAHMLLPAPAGEGQVQGGCGVGPGVLALPAAAGGARGGKSADRQSGSPVMLALLTARPPACLPAHSGCANFGWGLLWLSQHTQHAARQSTAAGQDPPRWHRIKLSSWCGRPSMRAASRVR